MTALRAAPLDTRTVVDGTELLTEMLRIPSVSGDERPLALWLVDTLGDAGFDACIDQAGNLIAQWGNGDREVMLAGHLDTVAGHIPVRVESSRLHGRGSVDAKGPLAAAIAAVSRQPCEGVRYVIAGLVEEETSSRGARHLLATHGAPSQLVVLEPSGWEGITIGYKGCVRLRWAVAQPSSHTAGAEPSAADRGVEFVRALQEHARSWSGDAGIFDRLDARVVACEAGGDGLEDAARFDISLRVPPAYDLAGLLDDIATLAGDVAIEVMSAEPPVRLDRNSRLARSFVAAIRSHGGAPRFKLKTGTADLNLLAPAWQCPALAYGPGDSRLDHTRDEHIQLDELAHGIDVLDAVLREL
jgi:[amino group carrier protein]-lysine/ornithine hydrolase